MEKGLTPAQQRTLAARRAFAARFGSSEEQSEHFRALARRSHQRRVTLSTDEAAALLDACDLLRRIAERAQKGAAHAAV